MQSSNPLVDRQNVCFTVDGTPFSIHRIIYIWSSFGQSWLIDCFLQNTKFQISALFVYLIYISPPFTSADSCFKKPLPILLPPLSKNCHWPAMTGGTPELNPSTPSILLRIHWISEICESTENGKQNDRNQFGNLTFWTLPPPILEIVTQKSYPMPTLAYLARMHTHQHTVV